MKPMQFNSTTIQAGQESGMSARQSLRQELSALKALARNSWFLLGNVLLLIGGDDSVELCLTSSALQLTNHSSIAMSAHVSEDSGA